MIVTDVAALLLGADEAVGLYTTATLLLLPYALYRWGSGREAELGLAMMVSAGVLGTAVDYTGAVDAVGGGVFLLFPAVLGAAVRYRGYLAAPLLGGTLEAGPGPERGWTVNAMLPRAGSVR